MNRVQGGQGPTGPVEGRPPEPAGADAREAPPAPLRLERVGELAGGAARPAAAVERVFRKPVVLGAAAVDSIVSARQALAFVEAGFEVDAFCPRGHGMARMNYVRSHHVFDAFDPVISLRQAIEQSEPDLVFASDGRAVACLHALHAVAAAEQGPAGERLGALIARSLGEPQHFDDLTSRCRVLELAHREGVRRPAALPVADEDELRRGLERFGFPAVLAADWSSDEGGRTVVRSPAEARRAFRRLSGPSGLTGALTRLLLERDRPYPAALRRRGPGVILQRFTPGRPAEAAVACWRGEVLTELCVEAVRTDGPRGPVSVVRTLDHPEMSSAVRRLARRFELSGLCGFDFLMDAEGAAWLVGINPFATPTCHLTAADGVEPASALRARLLDRPRPRRAPTSSGELIALFPQEVACNPDSAFLHFARHDIPSRSPALIGLGMRGVRRGRWKRWRKQVVRVFSDGPGPAPI
jgi:hypothetical protein